MERAWDKETRVGVCRRLPPCSARAPFFSCGCWRLPGCPTTSSARWCPTSPSCSRPSLPRSGWRGALDAPRAGCGGRGNPGPRLRELGRGSGLLGAARDPRARHPLPVGRRSGLSRLSRDRGRRSAAPPCRRRHAGTVAAIPGRRDDDVRRGPDQLDDLAGCRRRRGCRGGTARRGPARGVSRPRRGAHRAHGHHAGQEPQAWARTRPGGGRAGRVEHLRQRIRIPDVDRRLRGGADRRRMGRRLPADLSRRAGAAPGARPERRKRRRTRDGRAHRLPARMCR